MYGQVEISLDAAMKMVEAHDQEFTQKLTAAEHKLATADQTIRALQEEVASMKQQNLCRSQELKTASQERPLLIDKPGSATAEPLPVVPRIHVVSDSAGFVAAFLNREQIVTAILEKYPEQNFVIQSFPMSEEHSKSEVFIIPYITINSVAFVSNDRAECQRVHQALLRVGLTYDDDVDFWKHPVGIVCAPAKKRLDHMRETVVVAAGVLEERLFESMKPMKGGPIEAALREMQKITIMDSVISVSAVPACDPPS